MRKIVSIICGPMAALLCVGIAGAQATSQPRASTPSSTTEAPKEAAPSKEPAATKSPGKTSRAAAKSARPATSKSKAAADEGEVDPETVAEGDDGAGTGPMEAANEAPPPPPPARPSAQPRPAAPSPSPANGNASSNASEAVDGPMVMGLMGGNINQMMRGGLMNMCPCATKSTLVQVSKLPKGVSISYVSDDPKVVERLQKMADGVRLMRDAWAD